MTAFFLFLKTIFGIFTGREGKNAQTAAFIVIGLFLLTIICTVVGLKIYFSPSDLEKNINANRPVIEQNQSEVNAREQKIEEQGKTVREAEKTSQNASKRQKEAIGKDSKEYANTNSGERFCERFPEDSTCK